MSPVSARRLAWGLAALALALMIGGFVLYATTDPFQLGAQGLVGYAVTPVFAIVGVLVASRQPRNAIGWIFLGGAVFSGLASLAEGFAEYRLQADADPGALTGAAVAYLYVAWIPTTPVPATFLLLLFPDGRGSRRRAGAWSRGAPEPQSSGCS